MLCSPLKTKLKSTYVVVFIPDYVVGGKIGFILHPIGY